MKLSAQKDMNERIAKTIDQSVEEHLGLYTYLHQNPELSFMEVNTAKRIQKELETAGVKVHPNFSGNSLVGLYENGDGPVIMLRCDLDALPILEKTNLDYASTARMKNLEGDEVPLMHACGHDMHMSVFMATVKSMIKLKDHWKGSLVLVAQQAEEKSGGAANLIKAGLFKKFPVPNYAFAYHVSSSLPAGSIGYCPQATFAGVSSVDVKFKGIGGHGAYPHKTIDPVVMASQAVLAYQSIVSREIDPTHAAVVTVGTIHGGSQRNIIPDEVNLQLTIRYYKPEIEEHIISSIKRISKQIALSYGISEDKLPVVKVLNESTPPVINNDELLQKAVKSYENIIGKENIVKVEPQMVGEDFGQYGLSKENIPIFLSWLGSVPKIKYKQSVKTGEALPPLHSPHYYPDPKPTLVTGTKASVRALIDLMQ